MATVHIALGFLILILAVVATIVEIARTDGVPRGLRGATIGLFDLEVLLGIFTWIFTKQSVSFIAHPIFMVIAVVIAHIFTGRKRSRGTRITGWIVAVVILILGASLFR